MQGQLIMLPVSTGPCAVGPCSIMYIALQISRVLYRSRAVIPSWKVKSLKTFVALQVNVPLIHSLYMHQQDHVTSTAERRGCRR